MNFVEEYALGAALLEDEEGVAEELNKLNYWELRGFLDALALIEEIGYPRLRELKNASK